MPNGSYSSESDSSEDEKLVQLREAADTDLINDLMFKEAGSKSVGQRSQSFSDPTKVQKSQRHIDTNSDHIDDLLIPEEVQKFVSKKLAKIIDNQVEFVDIHQNVSETTTEIQQEEIKLLDDVVLKIDWNKNEDTDREQRTRPVIQKRVLPDVDDCKSKRVRLNEAVIDVQSIQEEVSNWSNKSKGTLFEYREKYGKLFEVEEKTEFAEERKKNNWDETKISKKINIFG